MRIGSCRKDQSDMTEQRTFIRDTTEWPLISVIMPAYNSAKTIERAMRSVIGQSYPETELIVIDSGSADDTAEVVKRIAAQEKGQIDIRLIEKENEGVSAARNEGIRAVKGKYFVSLDADDYYERDTLAGLYKAAAEGKADTAIGGMRKVYESNDALNEGFAPGSQYTGDLKSFMDDCFPKLYDLHLISTHSNKLYSTKIVRDNSLYYNEKLAVNEDIDFVLRYLSHCKSIAVLPDIFLNYVQHGVGESLINTFQPHGLEGALIVLHSCRELMKLSGAGEKTVSEMNDRMFVHICSFAGLMYYRSGYDDAHIRKELVKMCASSDFEQLLSQMRPRGIKNTAAHFLLKHKLIGSYHILCKLIYSNT